MKDFFFIACLGKTMIQFSHPIEDLNTRPVKPAISSPIIHRFLLSALSLSFFFFFFLYAWQWLPGLFSLSIPTTNEDRNLNQFQAYIFNPWMNFSKAESKGTL
jgi:hypothetical protein